jgi:hypothetical protein
LDADIRIGDVGDVSGGVVVGLDAAAVLRVVDCRVGELSCVSIFASSRLQHVSEKGERGGYTKIFVTLLLLFPPTDPILSPWPP